MTIHVIGGVYREICAWPERFHLLGSAGRAALCITNLCRDIDVVLHTKIAKKDEEELAALFAFSKCQLDISFQKETTEFFYDHPLATPKIYPDDCLRSDLPIYSEHEIDGEDVVLFGMIDSVPSVQANTLIYDPQNVKTPQLLSQMQCGGKQILYV